VAGRAPTSVSIRTPGYLREARDDAELLDTAQRLCQSRWSTMGGGLGGDHYQRREPPALQPPRNISTMGRWRSPRDSAYPGTRAIRYSRGGCIARMLA